MKKFHAFWPTKCVFLCLWFSIVVIVKQPCKQAPNEAHSDRDQGNAYLRKIYVVSQQLLQSTTAPAVADIVYFAIMNTEQDNACRTRNYINLL